MRVVHVVCTNNFAGVERYAAVLAVSQAARGHGVTVVGGEPGAMQDAGVRQVATGSVMRTVPVLDSLRTADVFHVHMTEAEGAALLALRARRVPVVATRHFAAVRGKTLLGRLSRPLIRRRLDAQIAVSRYVASRIDGPSTVVYPGVVSRPDADESLRRRTVLIAQRLDEEKDTALGLDAFARSGLAAAGWTLEIAGRGVLRPSLEEQARRLGIADRVSFLGFVPDMDVALSRCGMLLATPPAEHFGLSVLEAMSWGTPVVAAASAGHLETVAVAGDAGLFAPGDADAAAASLRRLARDAGLRRTYGVALRDVQRKVFTLEAQTDGVEAVYGSVL